MDRISKLSIGIIETILCFLPIQEAARTSILSREWRYHWTKIPKLVFNEYTFEVSTDRAEPSVLEQTFDKPSKRREMHKRCKFFYAIYQVLLMHEGPIHEFTLSMGVDTSCVEIDQILRHLSKKNTLKMLKLSFCAGGDVGYKLPISLFSLHQLTSLYLSGCALYQQRSFNEFGYLTTLHLEGVWMYENMLLRLLSSCPFLKSLTLDNGSTFIYDDGHTTIVDLLECLPVIEYLYVVFSFVEDFLRWRHPKELPTALVHLKYLCIHDLSFSHIYGLPFLALLIRSSPNLEKLKLVMYDEDLEEYEMGSYTLEDYSDITLEHLNELEIIRFSDAENELDFVKLIMAKSPVLKEVWISPCYDFDKDKESEIIKILCFTPCAAPLVNIMW